MAHEVTRHFFAVSWQGERWLGQDMDGQGLRANKSLANQHGLPIRVKEADQIKRVIMPDADAVDHVQWPNGAIAKPPGSAHWYQEFVDAHTQPCNCTPCRAALTFGWVLHPVVSEF